MLARVQSYLLQGIDALPCEVEVDLDSRGLDRETIVGLPDAAVKEALERVRAALGNAGYAFPAGRTLINLAPADVRKEGPVYDLPVAVGLLQVSGVIEAGLAGLDPRTLVFAGELALDGRLRPIKGGLALASMAARLGARGVVIPADNAAEAAVVGGIEVFGVRTLDEVVGLLTGLLEVEPAPPANVDGMLAAAEAEVDFAEVRGQESVKRALLISAAGGHNCVMIGPAGSGKTMMAKAFAGILPRMSAAEAIEVTRIYSAAGMLAPGEGLVTARPVRAPHHTASPPAIVGGGMVPRPGEISLAHRGVLFLDEMPEFPRTVLETLRQPMEDQTVTISRAHGSTSFPADFTLIAAMNPTPRGDIAPGEVGKREMERYMGKLSGPLLDRIDIHIEAPAVPYDQLRNGKEGTGSAEMRQRAHAARARQADRHGDAVVNARLTGKQLDSYAPMEPAAEALLGRAVTELGLSARAYTKVRRIARTIADLDGREALGVGDIAEAVQYRLLDRKT